LFFYSSIIFYAEHSDAYFDYPSVEWRYYETNEPTQFQSIPDSMWWCIVTITTVGYGDAAPHSKIGKVVASFCMFTSFMMLGLPISILSTNFSALYQEYDKKKRSERKKIMLMHRPSKPKPIMTTEITSFAETLIELQKDQTNLKEYLMTLKGLVREMEHKYERVNNAVAKITQKLQK